MSIGAVSNPVRFLLLVYMSGHLGGINALGGHELIHRREKVHRIAGSITFLKMLYMHFTTEHVSGHHVKIATYEDPATAREGESLYAFTFRSAWMGHRDTWRREVMRLSRRGKGPFSLENRMLHYIGCEVLLLSGTYYVFGSLAVFFHLLYSAYTILLGESVNYVEHYGLRRKKLENGHYESIHMRHCWNSPRAISNYLFFRIQRHSDHHVNSYRPYQILRNFDVAPQLPYGYA